MQTRITSNTNAVSSVHLGCRVGWSAAQSVILPDLLSDEVGGVVVPSLPLLVSQVDEDRGAEKRGLLLVEQGLRHCGPGLGGGGGWRPGMAGWLGRHCCEVGRA